MQINNEEVGTVANVMPAGGTREQRVAAEGASREGTPGFATASLRAPLCMPAAGPPSSVNSRFSRYCGGSTGMCVMIAAQHAQRQHSASG